MEDMVEVEIAGHTDLLMLMSYLEGTPLLKLVTDSAISAAAISVFHPNVELYIVYRTLAFQRWMELPSNHL